MPDQMQPQLALSSIWNPIDRSDKSFLSFHTTNTGDLSYSSWKLPHIDQTVFNNHDIKHTGVLKIPSSITALRWYDMIRVYGITSGPEAILKQISPVVMGTSQKIVIPKSTSLASAWSPDNKAWLYFLSVDPSDNQPVIKELELGVSSDGKILDETPRPDTQLAAVYYQLDGKEPERSLFYQGKSNVIYVKQILSTEHRAIQGTEVTRPATPLAACSAKDSGGATAIYVYFVDKENHIWRSRVTAQPDPPVRLDSLPRIAPWSQIGVVAGTDANYLTYIKAERDPIMKEYGMITVADDRK